VGHDPGHLRGRFHKSFAVCVRHGSVVWESTYWQAVLRRAPGPISAIGAKMAGQGQIAKDREGGDRDTLE
jgi:hypothetical protein